jgi:hypothetical protein
VVVDDGSWMDGVSGGGSSKQARPEVERVADECNDGYLNGEWHYTGVTKDGKAYYKRREPCFEWLWQSGNGYQSSIDFYIYFDKDCDGGGSQGAMGH